MRSYSLDLQRGKILSYRNLTILCTSLSDSLGIIKSINIAKALLRCLSSLDHYSLALILSKTLANPSASWAPSIL